MDGTLTEQGALDFGLIRSRIGCPQEAGILEFIASHDDEPSRARLMAVVEEEERLALAKVEIRPGAAETLNALRAQGVRTGVVTRNCEAAMRAVLVRIEHDFDVALSRSFEPCKPHPAPLLHILERVGASPKEAAMVGDSLDDMDCGNAAGTCTIAIGSKGDPIFERARPTSWACVESLPEILPLLGLGPLRTP
ncbi:hypothetical protein FNF27_02288 [Cafeteria roenbergensis]|uniref:HAD family hydrolase n=1 Tax=Cafeteria roenbergensis TaxID=33653 RepID=A0A5A8DDT6_CAFRO|nr:hypothetical protein FNF28_04214 [Cafeteria roenbergensis]KAA0168066.1 hypothetical protein FNF31_00565 [Cafeteria roenbergensis]KAA0176231.1 hypothetical protein FNF27_02288 [Cafeteria roenbergensis]